MRVGNKDYYRIIKCESNIFTIDVDGEIIACLARKKVKKNSQILVGDFVSFEKSAGEAVLEQVLERKNLLVRPNVANIDQLIIVAAPVPQIDYLLLDKLIINAHKQKLNIVLCLNKTDISKAEFVSLRVQYADAVDEIICVSAAKNDILELENCLKGKLSCFAGQSAVGKSTITNALIKSERQNVGALSVKSQKGKNTTTKAEIIVLDTDTYIIDTPGFTMLDIFDIDYRDLHLYYSEYVENSSCRYHSCTHTAEPECNIKKLVAEGTLSSSRYERYLVLYNELKSKEEKKY